MYFSTADKAIRKAFPSPGLKSNGQLKFFIINTLQPWSSKEADSAPRGHLVMSGDIFLNFFKRFYLFILREREREGERGEKHWSVASALHPDRGPGLQTFTLWGDAQPTEPHLSGLETFLIITHDQILLAFSGYRSGMLLNIPQCTGQPLCQQKDLSSPYVSSVVVEKPAL